VNYHRKLADLKPVALDAKLTCSCELHAKYLHRNRGLSETRDLRSHTENPKRPGYTKEGAVGSVAVLDCISGRNRPEITPIACPGTNQTHMPLRFVPENPNSVPSAPERAGYPITLQFRPYGQKITTVRAMPSANGRAVACHPSTPQKPASYYDQQNAICLIPKRRLAPGQKYFVSIMARVDGQPFERKWSFTTAAR